MTVGTLDLVTPWVRAAFTTDDRRVLQSVIPAGYRINVIALNPHRFIVVALRESRDQHPVEVFRSTSTSDPVGTALAMVERLRMDAETREVVRVLLSYERCATCGHRLDDYGGCDSCTADAEAREREYKDAG